MTRLVLLLVTLIATSSAFAQSSAFWQWTTRGYTSKSAAVAAFASVELGAIIETADSIVATDGTSTPFVVVAYELTDFWCCAPSHFTHQVKPNRPWQADAIALYQNWRSFTLRKSGFTALPNGDAVVWRTY